jgi:hypothetical protein
MRFGVNEQYLNFAVEVILTTPQPPFMKVNGTMITMVRFLADMKSA